MKVKGEYGIENARFFKSAKSVKLILQNCEKHDNIRYELHIIFYK